MSVVTVLLIGIVANLDNVGISISYGLRFNRIPFKYNLTISFISMVFAIISLEAGAYFADILKTQAANLIGGSLLIAIGIWLIIKSIFFEQAPTRKEITTIDLREAVTVGFIMALNCLTIGFGAGITGAPSLQTAFSIGVFSIVSIIIGVELGHKIGNTWFGKNADNVGAILLIIIGLYEIFI
ncbi:manganese efflux pump [Sporosarcina oncorhynchi]|uniref:Manganese efflux pump n=1 Tax=Sporosarcina oncorhynchi TaxID=3056444 RepID=A0ABZ0L8R4_9BACL|nr:manganese efflux pump [Sporosarcina sp. T2O-4]WOV88926.1 manganese efflux pump [Sporosarcina sp. T2O-4]